MRGSHPGSFEAAHALRDGASMGRAVDTGESYDLVVVGAGISGLAAAQFFRARAAPGARILLLDNHDDFGGHAKRNEFQLGGRTELLNGGTLLIESPESPADPILLHMLRTPCRPGLTEDEQHKVGREELLATSFATFERNIRDQLARALGDGGFDPARDIEAITVNRWPHGYAPEYNPLFDPDVPEAQRPWVRGRAPFGRIVIANSDSGGGAYTDVAIDQADRAVQELLRS